MTYCILCHRPSHGHLFCQDCQDFEEITYPRDREEPEYPELFDATFE